MAAQESALSVVGYGNGGFEEMRNYVDDSAVQFGLTRFELGKGSLRRYKFLFVHVNGTNCPTISRGKANACLNDAMETMRGGEVEDTFAARVEITENSQMTAEYILSRVGNHFVPDDVGEYSVKWLLENYQQFIDAAKNKKATSSASNQDFDRKVKLPGHKSTSLFASGRDALKAVAEPLGAWNWVFLGSDPDALPLVAGGAGSVDEMRESMIEHEKDVLFGLLRMGFGVGRLRRTKHVFVQAIGAKVSAFQKGKLGALKPKMEKALGQFALCSCSIEYADSEDFTVEDVIERVRQAAIIDDEEIEGDKAGKNIFSVEHFREALREEMGAHGHEEEKQQPKAKGGFGDKTVGEVVKLIRTPDCEMNWALFAVNEKHRMSLAAKEKKASLLAPDAKLIPQGGYLAAHKRESVATVASARARASTATVASSTGYPAHGGSSPVAEASDDEGQPNPFRDKLRPSRSGVAYKPATKARLAGALLKEAPGIIFGKRWQLRHFQIADGMLQWWQTLEEKQDGIPPRNQLDLMGLKVKRTGTKIELHSTDSMERKGRPYVLDANVAGYIVNADAAHDGKLWVQSMEQEAVLARSKRVSMPGSPHSPISPSRMGSRRCFSVSQ